ncbi:DnaD domain protein [Cytobacillus firmus]|uniref:DnaD domain protein n=1 Tax=Cytobacillus firmus TaxID=1399 RepID=UPI002040D71B|nr:DnaD domain protein [Cytobacillus firmus]MCM3708568.1 DnaD domain protein [Cytobacillus firmus]
MSIVRTMKRENPFVQLDKQYIGNGTLSLKATGLLTYILSRPDGWQIRMKDIQNKFNDGETSVRSAMKELISTGYVNRYRERTENGTFGDWIYDVYERPEFNPKYNPKRENQVLEPKRDFPDLDNPDLENNSYSNNDFSNNDFSNKEEEEEASSLISLFEKLITPSNEAVANQIKSWLKHLPFEVIKNEIEYSALRNAKSWMYIDKALTEDKNMGIMDITGLEMKRTEHAAKQRKPKKSNNKAGTRKPIRKEQDPDEIFQRYENEAIKNKTAKNDSDSKSEKKSVRDILKKLEAVK